MTALAGWIAYYAGVFLGGLLLGMVLGMVFGSWPVPPTYVPPIANPTPPSLDELRPGTVTPSV